MKREQITELFPNATKEQIDKIMSLNGADINSAKGELDTLKGQLSTAQGELEKLKKASQQEPDKLKEAADAIKALQTELAGMKQAETLRAILAEPGPSLTVVKLPENLGFAPKLSSRKLEDGTLV